MSIAFQDNYTLSFFTASSGSESARLEGDDGSLLHLHSLVDPESEADFFSDVSLWGDTVFLAGTGLGYHLRHILFNMRPSVKIILADFYPELAEYTARYVKKVTGISPITVTRENSEELLRTTLFSSSSRSLQVIRHPVAYRAHQQFYDTILKKLQSGRGSRQQWETILTLQGRFFLEHELGNAAQAIGKTSESFAYNRIESIQEYESRLQKVINESSPRCIISVNMLGVDHNGIFSSYTRQYGIPSVHWFVDDPRPILLSRRHSITSDMSAFTWEREYLPVLKEAGFGTVGYLPLAADDTKAMRTCNTAPKIGTAFLGSSMGGAFLEEITRKCLWKPEYAAIARTAAEELLDERITDIDGWISERLRESGGGDLTTVTWVRSYILHLASMLKRCQLLMPLVSESVELFGDENEWRELLGDKIITHPPCDYQTESSGVYNDTAVNINITSCQMPTALNQRVFDVPYNGGFLLTDNQRDLETLFNEDEYMVYHSPADLKDKVRFYLHNDSARVSVIRAAQKKISLQHTYRHRLETILHSL